MLHSTYVTYKLISQFHSSCRPYDLKAQQQKQIQTELTASPLFYEITVNDILKELLNIGLDLLLCVHDVLEELGVVPGAYPCAKTKSASDINISLSFVLCAQTPARTPRLH